MSEIKDFSTAELVAELIRRKKISTHTLLSIDRMNIGRRAAAVQRGEEPVGVVFTNVRKVRLVLNLPDIEVDSAKGESVEDFLTADALSDNMLWHIESEDRFVRSC